ncbi:lysophospholipase L2 [Budviciaceae bacterium CWB-B4]|uniref:Lysophospholipase L2 n=1 Tax=Limnobaculum xujianqingii TaxID=2738837 RepID=A0A9D7FZA5_9GAMM|nr:lysophospholipase L2 [Limnobaculum xujianqingii]MBK5074267.1 lysophospholipase L2 [Limnobaculum xujianqingii]MBK5177576.1 lysophospholipase L2 [Limnobaculum xujianqingii]
MTVDFSSFQNEWLSREKRFSSFVAGPLLSFWQQREECSFNGADGVPIKYVKFTAEENQRAIVVVTGRTEGYIKYQELAYDLFRCGYDVWILDHRGQGFSGRLLDDGQRGHVEKFDDYVDDFEFFWRTIFEAENHKPAFLLAHSMGGAIAALFLARHPNSVRAAALCSPMLGIALPMPSWLAKKITDLTERWQGAREYYAMGTGRWLPMPYAVNLLTHSKDRYRLFSRHYADRPELRIGGPTYRWVRESMMAGERAIELAPEITTPLIILQASQERLVDNDAHVAFCQALADAGHPCEGGSPRVIEGARHEILFEHDELRTEALMDILGFFDRY